MARRCCVTVVICLFFCAAADPISAQIWRPYAELEGRTSDEREVGQGRLFVPLFQDSDELFFADIRGLWTDESAAEGNWGLAYRKIINCRYIFGIYAFYDQRHTEEDNSFHQGAFGVELLSVCSGIRFNGYIPDQGVQDAPGAAVGPQQGQEAAYWGLDIEFERRVWCHQSCCGGCSSCCCLDAELWVAAGAFHFDNDEDEFENITGPRVRAELRLYDLPILGAGSRLVLSGQYEYDDVRGSVGSGFVTLRIPLGCKRRAPRLRGLQRRMVAPVVRDIDIITVAGPFGETTFCKCNR